jgi:phenylacetate-CoA ligase
MQLETILRVKPSVLVAVPSFIAGLTEFATRQGVDLNKTSVKKIICIGENIRYEDFSPNALATRITSEWNVSLFSTYASTEQQTAFSECEAGSGGHHHFDLLSFEILDENDHPLPPGEFGELTITTLGVEGMPLLRYKTGDICAYFIEPCSCGRHSARISPIRGRKKQLIKYKGTTLYPQSLFNIMNKSDYVQDYVIHLLKGELETDDLKIHVAVRELNEQVHNRIRQDIQSALRVVPEIVYLPLGEIQKMQVVEGKRKLYKLVDLR